MISMQTVVERR